MKILIADDHLVVRKGLIQIIKEDFTDAKIEESSDGKEALHFLRTQEYNIAILDITMPLMSGLDVTKTAMAESIKTPILILTSHPEGQYALRVLRAGASGFIGKETAAEELTLAIRKIISGRKYITGSLAEKLADELLNERKKAIHETLSDREFEVMKLIADGKIVSEIAEILHLNVTTISTYRARILEKTGLKNNAELMHYVFSQDFYRFP